MMSSPRSIPTAAEDRISTLPDPILCHILSFLPTKLSVATSIISKRWKPLWESVLTLDFDGENLKDLESFRYFVYSVFVSRDATLPLKSLHIRCGNSKNFDAYDLKRFIHAAVQRRLENFELDLIDDYLYDKKETVPGLLSLLSCRTLVVLKLKKFTVYHVPNLVDFPLLKTLHLDEINFICTIVHFLNLVRGCPILEDFYTNDLMLPDIMLPDLLLDDSVGEFKGFPKLVRANLCYSDENFPFAWLYNAKFLRAQLTSTTYEYRVPTFRNLTCMELIFDSDSWPWKWKFVIQVLQHCPNLQNLTLDEETEDTLPTGDNDWTEPETIPECLSFQLRKCSLRSFDGIECELQFAEYILLNSKLLCTMIVKSNSYLDGNEKLQMLVKLSSYPRGSATCKLLFD